MGRYCVKCGKEIYLNANVGQVQSLKVYVKAVVVDEKEKMMAAGFCRNTGRITAVSYRKRFYIFEIFFKKVFLTLVLYRCAAVCTECCILFQRCAT